MHQQTRATIDWLTCTTAWKATEAPEDTARNTLVQLNSFLPINPAKPYPYNYSKALAGPYCTVSWHPDHRRMKLCTNFTGNGCKAYYNDGGDMRRLFRYFWSDFAHFTRVDFAIDYFGKADIGALVEVLESDPLCKEARIVTPYQQIENEGTQVTKRHSGCYIGSQKSDRYICVYDKALEQKIDGMDWTRIELRQRKAFANLFADLAIRNGVTTTGVSIIDELAKPPLAWWQDALEGEKIEVPPIGRKETDTRRWLIEVVAPVLKYELGLVTDPGDPLFDTYNRIVNQARWDMAHNLD